MVSSKLIKRETSWSLWALPKSDYAFNRFNQAKSQTCLEKIHLEKILNLLLGNSISGMTSKASLLSIQAIKGTIFWISFQSMTNPFVLSFFYTYIQRYSSLKRRRLKQAWKVFFDPQTMFQMLSFITAKIFSAIDDKLYHFLQLNMPL